MSGNKKKNIDNLWDEYIPCLSVDCVIFGYHEHELKILILEYKNTGLFALPGGFVLKDEDLNRAAERVLSDRTGLEDIYLEQFYTFGDTSRHDTGPMKAVLRANGIEPSDDHWLLQRFVSVGYYALVDFSETQPTPDELSDSCKWYDVDDLPALIQDHRHIVEKARQTLQENMDHKVVGFNLLRDTFTMSELQSLYETILGEDLNRTSFHRKMVNSGLLKRLGKKMTGGAHRAPYLYEFVEE